MTFSASKATRSVRASIESDTQYGAVVPPLHLSSNFAFTGFDEPRQYDYTRSGNQRATHWLTLWRIWRAGQVRS